MVEVFKTNVQHPQHAIMLIDQIQKAFANYTVNFDLQDCDKILRVKCTAGLIKSGDLIELVNEFGFHAEVLPDEPMPFQPVVSLARGFVRRNQLN